MSRLLLLLICWVPFFANACGIHQDTGLFLVTEPGSLPVFENTVNERQNGRFNSLKSPEHVKVYQFTKVLSNSNQKVSFSLFEPVKGHYSEVLISEHTKLQHRETQPSPTELLLIAELDVLEALATKQLSWSDAKTLGLVRINGQAKDIAMLERWFVDLF
ncbi:MULTISPECIES: hypothetical protein [unclassified Shewanella]|uniref:hypothetical protein n=1 Tax=unclassified Shewanella TaxID=196818 RepID=UPI003552AC8F